MSSEAVQACSTDNLGKLKHDYPDGFFLMISQPGCAGCEEVRGILTETVKDVKPIIEAGLEDGSCRSMAEELNVGMTPTVIWYKGDQEKRIVPDGKLTPDDIRAQVRELIS